MKRASLALVLLVVGTAACSDATGSDSGPSGASFVINGGFDGAGHPNVGALLYDFDSNGLSGFDFHCSGVLVAPTVFLTAAHCLIGFPANAVFSVTFDENLVDNGAIPSGLIQAVSASANPAFLMPPRGGFGGADLGVLLLPPGSTAGITPATLPTANWLSSLGTAGLRASRYDGVGYGVSSLARGRPSFSWNGLRNVAISPFMSLTSTRLGLLQNVTATGMGGDCYGDSGSPKFASGTNTVVSITSWGDVNCRATSWSVRLDTPGARGFLAGFMPLP